MVAVVVVEREVVLTIVAGVHFRLAVALLELELVDAPVPQREASPEEVVRGVRAQNLRGGKLPGAADGDADVRDRRQVYDAQLLARRAVDVPGHAAVGELDADGVVQAVVVYPRNPTPGIAHEGAYFYSPILGRMMPFPEFHIYDSLYHRYMLLNFG